MALPYTIKASQLRGLILLLVLLPFPPIALVIRFMMESVRSEGEAMYERLASVYRNHLQTAALYLDNQLRNELGTVDWESPAEEIARSLKSAGLASGLVAWPPGNGASPARFGDAASFDVGSWVPPSRDGWVPVGPGLHARPFAYGDRKFVLLRSSAQQLENIRAFFQSSMGPEARVIVRDPTPQDRPQPFSTESRISLMLPAGPMLPGFLVGLNLDRDESLEKTLGEQTILYKQTSAVVIALVLVVAVSAGLTVLRRLRLNDLQTGALAAVAHELKTPIASMKILLETLREGRQQGTSATREYLDLMHEENERLGRAVENFLALAKAHSRDYRPRRRPVLAEDLIEAARQSLALLFEREGATLVARVAPGTPPLMADPESLRLALVNLFENAVKYSAELKRIEVSARPDGRYVLLEVTDHGQGIPPEDLRRIFRPFWQSDNRLTRAQEGCGLGLSIVRAAVRSHRGKLGAASEPGLGTTFSLRIPSARS